MIQVNWCLARNPMPRHGIGRMSDPAYSLRKARPGGVSSMPRARRFRSWAPASSSRSRICRINGDCELESVRAGQRTVRRNSRCTPFLMTSAELSWTTKFADFLSTPEVGYQQFGYTTNCNSIESIYAALYHNKSLICLAAVRVVPQRKPGRLKGVCAGHRRVVCTGTGLHHRFVNRASEVQPRSAF
jgi:hypothetical protein